MSPNRNHFNFLGAVNPAPALLVDAGYMTSGTSIATSAAPSPLKVAKKGKRKSVKGQTNEFRKNRKIKNMGIGNEMVARLPDCVAKCNTKTTKDEWQLIWSDFRLIRDNDQRYRYLAQLINITPPKRNTLSRKDRKQSRSKSMKYYLKPCAQLDNGSDENVLCQQCFMKVFALTKSKIRTIVQKKQQNGQHCKITLQVSLVTSFLRRHV